MASKSAARRLRDLLRRSPIVVAPGAPDALTARLVAEAGFAAVHATGGGIARSRGVPDLGVTTLTELVERVASMTEACSLPVIADADSGYGGNLNVARAIRLLERAGAAGVHLEDEHVPRQAPQAAANLLDPGEMATRIGAALAARADPDFAIIARTNAVPALGLDAAIDRANRYADAGADLVYVESTRTRRDMETVARRVKAPRLISINKGVNEPVTPAALAEMGYRIVTHPADTQLAAIHAIRAVLGHLKANGTSEAFAAMVPFAERDVIVGTAEYRAREWPSR